MPQRNENESDGQRRPVFRSMSRVTGPLQFVGRLAGGESGNAPKPADTGLTTAFPAGTFLGELGAAYAAELATIGRNRSFNAGEVIFREGEPARHVILILDGHAQVTVNSAGAARQIAVRGPGDLIGERAASLEPKRSATAIAGDDLRGTQVEAAAFTEFLQRNPQAVAVLEAQLYGRMTTPEPHTVLCGQNCTVLLIDIAQFSHDVRTDRDRLAMVKAFYRMLKNAVRNAKIDWNTCHCEDRGDGALLIIPAHVPTEDVVHRLVRRLVAGLRQHNEKALPVRRFQLRAAVDVGPVTAHEYGVNGETIISAARLIEATRLKAAVLDPDVVIGIAVSPYVYQRVVRHLPDADASEEIKFTVKGWKGSAWIRLYRS